MVASWLLSSGMRLRFVCAARSRLALLAFVQTFRRPQLLVGIVTTEAEALQRIGAHQAGMLICTDQLEEGDPFALVASARSLVPDLRVTMILCQSPPDVSRALAVGVDALVLDQELGGEDQPLNRALVAASSGRRYMSAGVEQALKLRPKEASEEPMARLTPREEEVLTLIISGCTDREIAERLSLSPQTVRGYSKDIRRKFGARSRVELLGKALRKAMGRRQRLR